MFQSTPPAWGATWADVYSDMLGVVSIHAPRVGGDTTHPGSGAGICGFNPRPPRGGRPSVSRLPARDEVFQSTPPAWGATDILRAREVGIRFQSTPPAWGATRASADDQIDDTFQSTPPAWGATYDIADPAARIRVSIHAPRVGGDAFATLVPTSGPGFNPRPPRGGRPSVSRLPARDEAFQSTPPAWGATQEAED